MIRLHCTVTGLKVEDIGLLTVQRGNVICVLVKAMKQEIVNPLCQAQEDRAKMVTLCGRKQVSADR